jgi:hypothetical protein
MWRGSQYMVVQGMRKDPGAAARAPHVSGIARLPRDVRERPSVSHRSRVDSPSPGPTGRSSTGTTTSPSVPVDDVYEMASVPVSSENDGSMVSSFSAAPLPTTVDLFRQLEACVRDLLEINSRQRS